MRSKTVQYDNAKLFLVKQKIKVVTVEIPLDKTDTILLTRAILINSFIIPV